jgi:DNA-binding transcriptional ArsR family regulator
MADLVSDVLAHPLRDRILFEYQAGPTCPSAVARRLDRPLNLVSYHTRVLESAGCVELVRTERHRGGLRHYYRATVKQYIEDAEWRQLAPGRRRALTLGTLGRIADEARACALAGAYDAPGSHLSRVPVELDPQGVRDVAELLRRTFDDLARIAARSRSRAGRRRAHTVSISAFPVRPPAPRS